MCLFQFTNERVDSIKGTYFYVFCSGNVITFNFLSKYELHLLDPCKKILFYNVALYLRHSIIFILLFSYIFRYSCVIFIERGRSTQVYTISNLSSAFKTAQNASVCFINFTKESFLFFTFAVTLGINIIASIIRLQ